MSTPALVTPLRLAALPVSGEYVGQLVIVAGSGAIYAWSSGAQRGYYSVGGTSSVIGLALASLYTETDY